MISSKPVTVKMEYIYIFSLDKLIEADEFTSIYLSLAIYVL